MKLAEHIELIGSGQMGFNLTHPLDGNDAIIVDAGAGINIEPILRQIDESSIPRDSIRRLLLSHAHPDHAGGTRALHDAMGVDVYASHVAASSARDGDERAASFDRLCGPGGYPEDYAFAACPVADELREGERITVGRLAIEVIETPGHCGGHVSFVLRRPDGVDLLSGDAIFTRGRILLQNLLDCSVAGSCCLARANTYSPSARPTPRPRASLATMKLAVATCEPGPGRFGPIFAVPSTRGPSQATNVSLGDASTQTPRACSDDQSGSKAYVSPASAISLKIGQTDGQSVSL